MKNHHLLIVSFAGGFASALSMADNLGDIRTYLKAFVIGLGASGLLKAKLPDAGPGRDAVPGVHPEPHQFTRPGKGS